MYDVCESNLHSTKAYIATTTFIINIIAQIALITCRIYLDVSKFVGLCVVGSTSIDKSINVCSGKMICVCLRQDSN